MSRVPPPFPYLFLSVFPQTLSWSRDPWFVKKGLVGCKPTYALVWRIFVCSNVWCQIDWIAQQLEELGVMVQATPKSTSKPQNSAGLLNHLFRRSWWRRLLIASFSLSRSVPDKNTIRKICFSSRTSTEYVGPSKLKSGNIRFEVSKCSWILMVLKKVPSIYDKSMIV